MSTQQIDAGLRCLNVLNAVQVNVDGVVEIDGVVEKQSVVPIPYESSYPLDSPSAAALQGLKEAQYSLGVCYYNGDGVEQDNDKAAYWILKAADQGHKQAQELLEKWENEK